MNRTEKFIALILLGILALCFLIPRPTHAQFTVPQGGTQNNSFPSGAYIYGNGSSRLLSTTSPTFGWVTATSTTATSSFPRTSLTSAVNFLGDYITNTTTWIRGKIDAYLSGDEGIAYSSGSISFDCSEVEGTGINCVGEDVTLDAAGDWTGTLDGYEASSLLSNAFSTTSANYWQTVRNFFSTTSADYWKTQTNFHSTTSADYWESTKSRWATTSASFFASVGLSFSTTSADAWDTTKGRWATTSSDYWLTQRNFYSTTSANFWSSAGLGFSTTSMNYYAQASTTLAKTYSANSFTALQSFTNASTSLLTVSGNAWLPSLAIPAGTILATDPTGKIIATTTSSGGVASVGGVYPVISTGGTNPSISLGFSTTTNNTWSGTNTFTGNVTLGQATATSFFATTLNATAASSGSQVISNVRNSMLYTGATGAISGVATGTLSATSPLTGSFVQIGSGGSLGIQAGNGSQNGYISSTDWTSFNTRLSTTTLALIDKGFFFSTTSANVWASAGLGHSTTSMTYQLTQPVMLGRATSTGFAITTLTNCDTIDTDASGNLRCGSDSTGTGGAWPFTPNTNYGAAVQSTSTPLWGTNGLMASGTSHFVHATATMFTTNSLYIGSLSGILKSSNGLVSAASAGTDYESPLTFGFPLSRSANTVSWAGLSTSTPWSGGQLAMVSNGNTLVGVSTSTPTVTSPLQYSGTLGNFIGGSSGAFSILQSNASQNGYLSSTDWTSFNSRLSTTTLGLFDKGYFFGTTSALYFSSVGLAHSTTSMAYQLTQPVVLGRATSTGFAITTLPNCDTIDTDANGNLRCGTDNAGAGGAWPWSLTTNYGVAVNSTSTPTWHTAGTHASGTSHFVNASSTMLTTATAWITNLFIGADTLAEYISDTAGAFFTGNTETGITVTYQDSDNTVDVECITATAAAFGCIATADWTSFNSRLSTTTATTLASQGIFHSTTSANYWSSVGLGFSTTSANFWSSAGLGFSTTSTNYYMHASTTVPTTYKTITWSAINTFSAGLISNASTSINSTLGVSSTTTTNGLNVISPTVGTSTYYGYSKTSGFGGQIILEDEGGGACTIITTKAGTINGRVVTCPTEL